MKNTAIIAIPPLNQIEEVSLEGIITIQNVFQQVAKTLLLEERDFEFFGLTYPEKEEGRQVWTFPDDQIGSLNFRTDREENYVFRVRKFPFKSTDVSSNGRELLLLCIDFERRVNPFCIESHEDFHRRLATYKMHAYYGRFDPNDHEAGYTEKLQLLPLDFPSDKLQDAEEKISSFHRDIQMISKSKAVVEYLRAAYVAVCFTEVFFKVWKCHVLKSRPHEKALLAFGPHGLGTYIHRNSRYQCEKTYHWKDLKAGDLRFKPGKCERCSLISIQDLTDKFICYNDEVRAMERLFNDYFDSYDIGIDVEDVRFDE